MLCLYEGDNVKLKTLILAISLMTSFLSLPINADEMPAGPHLSITGTASMDAIPDMATLSIEVSYESKEATAAKSQVDKRIIKYFDFLRKKGVEKKDINTANLITEPVYDYQKNGQSVLRGYRAVRQLQVIVRQLNKLNELLDGALKLGLNEIRMVKLSVANPDNYRKQVRKKAIDNAILQAKSLAEGFSLKLGPVYSISYQGNHEQSMPPFMLLRAENASVSTPSQTYQQQTIHFQDQVEVVFELQSTVSALK